MEEDALSAFAFGNAVDYTQECNFVQVFSENSQILQGLSCKWRLGVPKNML